MAYLPPGTECNNPSPPPSQSSYLQPRVVIHSSPRPLPTLLHPLPLQQNSMPKNQEKKKREKPSIARHPSLSPFIPVNHDVPTPQHPPPTTTTPLHVSLPHIPLLSEAHNTPYIYHPLPPTRTVKK
ncbi:unnamed protein product [Periconia digitata]|uniref:Uncharacterized protein n=1 Tax=Periconia digitata TaxID=1303443 RepID=A0A9W4UEG4_9PLEO|nr:unnamed protein product [Periconia digitata]